MESPKPDLQSNDINIVEAAIDEVTVKEYTSDSAGCPNPGFTANTLKGDAEKALDAGCDVYMSKPINIRELWARVEAFMPNDAFLK